jgi:organic radical activating enzyme
MTAQSDDFRKNESFCILPWIHLMMTTTGDIHPCCVASDKEKFSSIDVEIDQAINSDQFKKLRLDMLQGVNNSVCADCHQSEKFNISSFRNFSNTTFQHHIDHVLDNTNSDGSIKEFKMRYLDARLSNICNFKCRTCNSNYSSSYAVEESKILNRQQRVSIIKPEKDTNSIQKIKNQLSNLEVIYFSGGEPLIMEEHYILLEELIKLKKTDITVRYNTNISTLRFKNTDVVDLWKHFDKVEVCASIDHCGARAEYIRHGTIWNDLESNIFEIIDMPNIDFGFNTVVSALNYASFGDFLIYMMDKLIYNKRTASKTSFNLCYSPDYFDPRIIPKNIKQLARDNLVNAIEYGKSKGIDHSYLLLPIVDYIESQDNWAEFKTQFQNSIMIRDAVRKETFKNVFPELTEMMDR